MAESGQILSDAEVEFLLEHSAAEATPAPTGPAPDPAAATMHGDLEQINLTDIFQTLAMAQMEGLLQVQGPEAERQLFCRNGTVQIRVPPRLATRRLGQRLLQAGLLTSDQLRSVLVRQQKDQRRLGEILVDDGTITQDQIDEIVAMQVAEDLFGLFTWRRGTFAFWKGLVTTPPLAEQFANCPEFEINSLLLEVARRADEWQSILQEIGSLDEVPQRAADAEAEAEIEDGIGQELWRRVDGHSSYRSIAAQTTYDLFDVAKVARDFSRQGWLVQVPDEALVASARQQSEAGRRTAALLLLQTLRDRPGTRAADVVRHMVEVLTACGAKRAAAELLLELAQQHDEPEQALRLARQAHRLLPQDLATLSFLRTTLLAHVAADNPELDQATLALVDALLAEDRTDTALEVLSETRAQGSVSAGLLAREAKAQQKVGHAEAAIAALMELAELHRKRGDRHRAAEALEAVLRLDNSRKDVRRLLQRHRQTRVARLVRSGVLTAGALLLAATGAVVWQNHRFDQSRRAAGEQIGTLLAQGERAAAHDALEQWLGVLGEGEAIEDLRRQVEFADAAEHSRLQKQARQRLQQRLAIAAEHLAAGELQTALGIYTDLSRHPELRAEVVEVVRNRLDGLLEEIERTAKGLVNRLPPTPGAIPDRHQLLQGREQLDAACRPALRLGVLDLLQVCRGDGLPPFVPQPLRERATEVLAAAGASFEKATALDAEYTRALERLATEVRLDPVFKAAVAKDAELDFPAALRLYQQLLDVPGGDPELRTELAHRVARNTAICRALTALASATEAGQAETALDAYRQLRSTYPEVPFERVVGLPMRLSSEPTGATVTAGERVVGRTPLVWVATPGQEVRLVLAKPGYRPLPVAIRTGEAPAATLPLYLLPEHDRRFEHRIEAAPTADGRGGNWLVDRSGGLHHFAELGGAPRWTFRSGDLSGLLTKPLAHAGVLWLGSLDGPLRGIDAETGNQRLLLAGLPTELPPVRVADRLVLATTDHRLVAIDPERGAQSELQTLPGRPAWLFATDRSLVVVTEDGTAAAVRADDGSSVWQVALPLRGEVGGIGTGQFAVLADDHGTWLGLDLASGTIAWQRELAGAFAAPSPAGPCVWATAPDRMVALGLQDGATVRTWPAAGTWSGPGVAAGARLLVPNRDGSVHLLDAENGQALGRIEGGKQPPRIHRLGDRGAMVALPDRRVLFFSSLP
jgi:tetratricopeptide (TPR) repeat protein/outer membrane protein assembly factor BamB